MFIVFDLDDTLIDTQGSILPIRHRECYDALVEAGAPIGSDFLERLGALDDRAENSKEALVSLLGEKSPFLSVALERIYGRCDFPFPIACVPGAKKVLSALAKRHTLALLTYGNPVAQREKIEKAGLDKALFSTIVVCSEPDKGPHYAAICAELGIDPREGVAIGDRVGRDLRPAKELGFHTVLMRWGRGRWQEADPSAVDAVIDGLEELEPMIEELCRPQHKSPQA